MKVLFWGAGRWGKVALEHFLQYKNSVYEFIGFLDTDKSRIGGEYCGYPILDVSNIPEDNVGIVITIANTKAVTEIYNQLPKRLQGSVYWYRRFISTNIEGDFLTTECISCEGWGETVLPQVEIHASDTCNLNCRGCAHFSPIFEDPNFDIESKLRDVDLLKQKFTHIISFYILGGEPFLNPEVGILASEVRKRLPQTDIYIVTNGLLIPSLSQQLLHELKLNNIRISISEYEPTHRMRETIESVLEKAEILYEFRAYDQRSVFNKPLDVNPDSKLPRKCISDGCINIWNGKISRCPTLMYIDRFNEVFGVNLPHDGIYELDSAFSGAELLAILSQDVPLCNHCVDNLMPWSQCGKVRKLEDFACQTE